MIRLNLPKGQQRRENILQLLKSKDRVSLQEIIDGFSCSEATARRDLDELEKKGQIIRTIGGAQYEGRNQLLEASFHEKRQVLWLEKEAIAAKAASLVKPGDIIGLTGGTTTFLIAKALKSMKGITVVTNAVNIAVELAEAEDIQVVVSGGVMRNKSFELCGPLTEKTLEGIHITKMFVGINGIKKEHGLTTYSEAEAQISKLLIKRSNETIAVFDHTKADRASLFPFASLTEVDSCITDAELNADLLKELKRCKVHVYKVEVNR